MCAKMENGSDTETDDEHFQHQDPRAAPPVDAPAPSVPNTVALKPEKAVLDAVTAARDVESVAIEETVAAFDGDLANAADDSTPTAGTAGHGAHPLEFLQLASPTLFKESEDGESARMQSTPIPATTSPDTPLTNSSTHEMFKVDAHPPLDISESKELVPVERDASTVTAVAAAPVAVKEDRQPYEGPAPVAVPVAAAPAASAASATKPLPILVSGGPAVVIPTSTQFKSPFSSLATQYQAPPPQATGAPPVYGGPQTIGESFPPTKRQAAIPCDVCSNALPENASPVPLDGHGVCSCCGSFYPSLVIRQNHPFCAACAPEAPAPSHPADPSPSNTTSSRMSVCFECKKAVKHAPPIDGKGLDCKCCFVWYDVSNFSRGQRFSKLRRCRSCAAGPHTPLKFVKKPKHPQYAADKQRHREKVKQWREERQNEESKKSKSKKKKKPQTDTANILQAARATPTSTSTQQASAPGEPPEVSQATPQERQEMEVDVRNIKLARRSIHRRRRANDLRGSTRLEYEMQLSQEEDKLNQKMNRMRRRNAALFDWFNQGLEIKGALGIAPSDWDHPLKGKKHQQKQKQNHTQKRKDSGGAEDSTSQAKRPRLAHPSVLPAPIRSSDTRPVKSDVKGVSSSAASASSEAPRAFATRARKAKPIEIIDLADSDY